MKVKVCGIKYQENLEDLATLPVDMIGFNFYSQSKRFLQPNTRLNIEALPDSLAKVGVFVNALPATLTEQQKRYKLDYLQLHGDDDIEAVATAKKIAKVIKVFRVNESFDFKLTEEFNSADLFLFDTYTAHYGGSGKKFDWDLLNKYNGPTPFLLAGGLSKKDAEALREWTHPQLYGVDINSGFEITPGLKDTNKVSQFLNKIKKQNL